MSSSSSPSAPLKLVAVIRFNDKTVIACQSASKDVTRQVVKNYIVGQTNIVVNKRISSDISSFTIHYILDSHGRVYCLVADSSYSQRVAFTAIAELMETFSREFGPKCANATENSLSKPAHGLLGGILQKWVI